jgi:alpha-beta hydrolase superfamily lysophospholipase
MNSADGSLTAGDGASLYCRQWKPLQPKAILLLVHGIAEHSGRYETLGQRLAQQHFAVWAPDQRGHGRSPGRRGDCLSIDQLVADLDAFVRKAADSCPSLPRVMVGHSLGGLLALTYAVQHHDRIRAVAVSSPALQLTRPISPLKTFVVTAASRIRPLLSFHNGVNPRNLCRDADVVKAYRRDPLVHRVITARCAIAVRDAMRDSLSLADRLRVPCLILQAGEDKVCLPEAAARFSKAIVRAPVTFRRYDGLYHELFNEPERQRVIDDLVRWLEEVLA